MTYIFYIDMTGVNGRQFMEYCLPFTDYILIYIVNQTNFCQQECDVKTNKYGVTQLEWSAVHELKYG